MADPPLIPNTHTVALPLLAGVGVPRLRYSQGVLSRYEP